MLTPGESRRGRHAALAGVVVSAIVVSGCSGAKNAAPPSTVISTVTRTQDATRTPEPESTSETSSEEPTSSSQSDAASTGPQRIQVDPNGQTLTLENAVPNDDWSAGSYSPPKSTSPVQGVRAALTSCATDASSTSYSKILELRFKPSQGDLKIGVAQDMDSGTSDATIEYSLIVDQKQKRIVNLKYRDEDELTTPLAGVSVVKVVARMLPEGDGYSCPGNAYALITKMQVDPATPSITS